MILRRFGRAFREQDWPAILIEFVIVVAGIFVGLQVTEWNEQRRLRERESTYLDRLGEDLATMKASTEDLLEGAAGRREAMLRVLRALETCSRDAAAPADFERAFTEYQSTRSARVVERTYREMLASGALATMSDRVLAGSIANLFAELDAYRAFVPAIRASMPVVDQIVWNRLRLSYDETGLPVLADFDFDALCREPQVQNAVVEMIDMQWDWEIATTRAGARIDEVAGEVERFLAGRGEEAAP